MQSALRVVLCGSGQVGNAVNVALKRP